MMVSGIATFLITGLGLAIKSSVGRSLGGFWSVVRELVEAGAVGALAGATGYGMAIAFKAMGVVAIVQGVAGGAAGAFFSAFISEFSEAAKNGWQINLGEAGFRIGFATFLGAITGGILVSLPVPEVNAPNSVFIRNIWLMSQHGEGFVVISRETVARFAGVWGTLVASGYAIGESIFQIMIKEAVDEAQR